MRPVLIDDPKTARDFVASIDTFLFDCDGVLWHGELLLPGVCDTLLLLRQLGKKCVFVTNNSTKSRAAYVQKFHSLGLDFVAKDDIFGAAYGAACYLKDMVQFPQTKKVFVIGQEGILDELNEQCISHYTVEDSHLDFLSQGPADFRRELIQEHEDIGAVLVGYDAQFSYRKLALASYYLRENKSCLFMATNRDSTYPTPFGIFPGTGCLVAALETASGQEPLVIGKPQKTFLDCILKRLELDPKRTCMVGDRLDTDVLFGLQGNLDTLLVLSGIAQEADLALAARPPKYYASSLGALGKFYQSSSP